MRVTVEGTAIEVTEFSVGGQIHVTYAREFCTHCRMHLRRSRQQRWCQVCHNEWNRRNRRTYAMLPLAEKERQRAGARLRSAVRRGKITRGPCEVCGSTRGVEGHHTAYSRPLSVRWLCGLCHRRAHR